MHKVQLNPNATHVYTFVSFFSLIRLIFFYSEASIYCMFVRMSVRLLDKGMIFSVHIPLIISSTKSLSVGLATKGKNKKI